MCKENNYMPLKTKGSMINILDKLILISIKIIIDIVFSFVHSKFCL